MLTTENSQVTIKCDKCGSSSTASLTEDYNKVFWEAGFVLNRGRKYEHLCFFCLPAQKQKAMTFVKTKLNF